MTTQVTEKRLRNELKDLKKNKLDFAQALQDENDKFLFYFLLIGDVDEEDPKNKAHSGQYKNGYYLGKIILPQDYPQKPGDFVFMTPSGRFKIGQKICLSNTGYHTETWSPIWSIRNMLLGLVSIFFSDKPDAQGANHLQMPKAERLKLAKESIDFNMKNHKDIFIKFDQFVNEDGSVKSRTEQINSIKPTEPIKPAEPIIPTAPPLPNKKQQDDDEDFELILQQLKQKDEEEAKIKKQQDDEYMAQAMKQIEENEKIELLKEVNKIDLAHNTHNTHNTYNTHNTKNELDELDDIYIVDEPEPEPEIKPKKTKSKLSIKKSDIPKTKTLSIKKSDISKTKTLIFKKPETMEQKLQKLIKLKNNGVSIDDRIEIIKKMTIETYDYKVFKEVNNLLGLNLNEL